MFEDDRKTDELLKAYFSEEIPVDPTLNAKLKAKTRERANDSDGFSIWWLPLLLSPPVFAILCFLACLTVTNPIIRLAVYAFCAVNTLSVVVFTIVGVKYFDLKKGVAI